MICHQEAALSEARLQSFYFVSLSCVKLGLSEKVAGGTFLNRNLTLFIRLVATLSELMKLISPLPGLTFKYSNAHTRALILYFCNVIAQTGA